MKVIQFNALSDNYNFIAYCNETKECVGIDIFNYEEFFQKINENNLNLIAILNTHHHSDHMGGNKEIKKKYPNIKFYASEYDFNNKRIDYQTDILRNGDQIKIGNEILNVLEIQGHTLGHLCYYNNDVAFVGDTVFASGCGRVFEGTHKQMFESIKRITEVINNETLIYCGHEYTMSNVNFALSLNNEYFKNYKEEISKKTNLKTPTVPTTLKLESKLNPFIMVLDDNLRKNILQLDLTPEDAFSILRSKKDTF